MDPKKVEVEDPPLEGCFKSSHDLQNLSKGMSRGISFIEIIQLDAKHSIFEVVQLDKS